MPLTDKGDKIMSNMKGEYGDKKGESVFYASKNAGKISGVDELPHPMGEGGISEATRGYHGQFASSGGGGSSKAEPAKPEPPEEGDLLKFDAAEVASVEKRFDEVRDQLHKVDQRIDDCAKDDRSSEGHAEAARNAPSGSIEKKFHEGEVGREDDCDMPSGGGAAP